MSETVVYQLICEGCNPNVDAIDQLVQESRPTDNSLPVLTDTLQSLLRRLKHTPHTTAGNTAICQQCGTRRRYGNGY